MPPPILDERLPAPKLDDRRFQDLVDEAKLRVQQRCPEWTDHNVSDPGVTLIETFAWMTDQLLYRLNRVPDLNYVKFLELLGVTLLPPTAASADLTFRLSKAQPKELEIPAGTQVSTPRSGSGEQITFATTAGLSILPCSRQTLASSDPRGTICLHDDEQQIVCFSDRPQPGDAFLVGLDKAVPSCVVRLYLPCRQGAGGGIAPDNPPLVWDARVGDDEGTVRIWNARTREPLARFTGYRGHALRCVAFSPDGHMLACAGDDGAVWLRDVHEPNHAGRRLDGHRGPVLAITFSGDGRTLASAGDDGAVWVWDVDAPEAGQEQGDPGRRLDAHDGPVFGVAFDPEGRTLASAGADGTVRLWSVVEHDLLRAWDVHEQREADPEPATNGTVPVGGRRRCVLGVAFVQGGQKVAAAGDDGALWVWDVRPADHLDTVQLDTVQLDTVQPETVRPETVRPETVQPETVQPETVQPATVQAETAHAETVQVATVQPETLQPERRVLGHRGPLFGVAFSPDGQTLATAGADGTARLWDIAGPVLQSRGHALMGHQSPVYGVAFSPDGQTVATVGSDWTARLWSVATGEQLERPVSDHCPVRAVAFHPHGDRLATAGLDGGWAACEVESDDTKGLNEAAFVVLHVPRRHRAAAVAGETAGWLRCRVRAVDHGQSPYDKSPVLAGESLAETIGATVAATNAETVFGELLGVSEGVSGQRFRLERHPVVPLPANEDYVLEVRVDGRMEEWREVTNFADAGEGDACFVLDHSGGEVALGPAVREQDRAGAERYRRYGAVPPKRAELRLRKYATGGGRRGNVSERTLTVLRSPIANVASVENRRAASGGVDGEDIENAKLRGPITLRTGDRAVTPEDYEQLAREAAPELARVECIPAMDDAHAGEARVLVIPKVESDHGQLRFEQLVPPVEMIDRIKGYLDERRVIGVRILVTPPQYHGITIAAKLVARREFDARDVNRRALEGLYTAFSPISGGRDGLGWEFGRPVLQGDVYAVLQAVRGVERVDDCRLFEANPVTGRRTPLAPASDRPGEEPHKIEVPVSRYATVFSYRHYVSVEEQ